MKIKWLRSERGDATLVTVLVAGAISLIVLKGVLSIAKTGVNAERHVELKDNLESIRQLILTSLDCYATFAEMGINPAAPGGSCSSTSRKGGQVGPFLHLRRLTLDGSRQYITGPLGADGSGKVGDWSLRATCSASEQSLVIRAARPQGPEVFLADPLTRQPAAWEGPKSLLFGGAPGIGGSPVPVPICFAATQPTTVRSAVLLNVKNPVATPGNLDGYPLSTPFEYLTVSPALPAVRARRDGTVLVTYIGNINWDGCPGLTDGMLFDPAYDISKDGGLTFGESRKPPYGILQSELVPNEGASFVHSFVWPVAAGNVIVVRPKIRFGMTTTCRNYLPPGVPCPISPTCVTDYNVAGTITVSVD